MKEILESDRENYGETALDIINQSSILKQEDFDVIVNLKAELLDNFLHSQVFRTRTEMEISVLNDMMFPTPDAKFWQCQREQGVHFHELVMLSYEYRKNLVEIRKLRKQRRRLSDGLDNEEEIELLTIEIEKLTFIVRNQERMAQDRIREVREWHEIKERLIPQLAHGMKDCNDHQLVSYTRRFILQWIAMGQNGSPGERQNLLSQMDMAIRICITKGLIGPILKDLSPELRHKLASQYQLNLKDLLKG